MLTPEEHFRLHETLPPAMIVEILDEIAAVPNTADAIDYIKEARSPFNAEDFLSDVISDLQTLKTKVRGDNKDSVQAILAKLEDIAQTTFNAVDHSNDQLAQALKALKV